MKKFFLLAAAVALFQPALAGAKAQSVPAKKGEPEINVKYLVGQIENWDSRLTSLKAEFLQEINFKDAEIRKEMKGVILYKKPDKLKIVHTGNTRQIVITDKKDILIYKPEDRQAVKTSWDKWLSRQSGDFAGLLNFGKYSELFRNNSAELLKDEKYYAVRLKPKKNPGSYSLTIYLSKEDFFPAAARLEVRETEISTRFVSVEKNPEIKDSEFKFKIPKGTEVIKF